MSRKQNRKVKQSKHPNLNPNQVNSISKSIEQSLTLLAEGRDGGAINFRGISFQLLYAIKTVLSNFQGDVGVDTIICPEGLEDIDVRREDGAEYVQIKTSKNVFDANTFWSLQILQHFMEIYLLAPGAKFRLVHNTSFAKGNLSAIGAKNIGKEQVEFWKNKLNERKKELDNKKTIPEQKWPEITTEITIGLLSAIEIEKTDDEALLNDVLSLLYNSYGINTRAEETYLKALFYNVFQWSKNRVSIRQVDISMLMQAVTDSFSYLPANPALQNNWLVPVSYEKDENEVLGYYDGKAARPQDIANGLAARRGKWEAHINESLNNFPITIIRSSSGQGKSTLAWQVGLAKQESGYSIYQIKQCRNYDEAVAIVDFLETRLRIGQILLVIIDGLSIQFSEWNTFAELMMGKPVKLLVTSREEDWIRYSVDGSKLSYNIVSISLSQSEAKDIYIELRKAGRIAIDVPSWEPCWERVSRKGLLIEYVYLLTRGEMIEARLSSQVSTINRERDAAAKLELLRLISTSDILNIRLRTRPVTSYLLKHFRLETDRNELYRQLEMEYYLKFDTDYIEGLHPVRSRHLSDLLHSSISVEQTLLTLIPLLDEDDLYDFFTAAPVEFPQLSRAFFSDATIYISGCSYKAMVGAIDGLMHYEAYKFLQQNRHVFDKALFVGGLDLLVFESAPLSTVESIKTFADVMPGPDGDNFRYLLSLKHELIPYSLLESNLFEFVKGLQTLLVPRPISADLVGLTFLVKWFRRLDLPVANVASIDENELISFLETEDIVSVTEALQFYYTLDPERYKQFIESNRLLIWPWIRKYIDCISISENNGDLELSYIWKETSASANELSMQRIDVVRKLFPYYKRYCAQTIVFPFPDASLHKALLSAAHKKIPLENMPDDFDVHINQIGIRTILHMFAADSSFEWQKQIKLFRELIVEHMKSFIRNVEAGLESNQSKTSKLNSELRKLHETISVKYPSLKKYPFGSHKYSKKRLFEKEQKDISDWMQSYINFLSQLTYLVDPAHEQFHLPVYNLKDAVQNLSKMQQAFEEIAANSTTYFDTSTLNDEEKKWLTRLHKTVSFIQIRLATGDIEKIVVAAREIERQWIEREGLELAYLHDIIKEYAQNSPYNLFLPTQILEDGLVRYAVVGVQGVDVTDGEQWVSLLKGLQKFHETKVHAVIFVAVNSANQATSAIHVNKEFFLIFLPNANLDPEQLENISMPIPQILTDSHLNCLEGVSPLPPQKNDDIDHSYASIIYDIWQLQQYREALDNDNPIENKWLAELEIKYARNIEHLIPRIYSNLTKLVLPKEEELRDFLAGNYSFTTDELVFYLANHASNISEQEYTH